MDTLAPPPALSNAGTGCSKRVFRWIFTITMLLAAALLFARLDHYALWDDETMVALTAKGVLKTGDTSALLDNGNIVAYCSGRLLNHLHDRSTPPLAAYCTALSFKIFGVSAWSARFPFALFGLATVALMLYWARKQPAYIVCLVAMGLLCNVTFLLQFRQCRYHGPSVFFPVAIVYLYYHWRGGWRPLAWMALASIGLFLSNYLLFVVVYLCLVVDYLIWKRREWALRLRDWCVLLAPQVLVCGVAALVWNPFRTAEGKLSHGSDFWERIQLIFWYFRDLDACEYYSLAVIAAALIAGVFYYRKYRLLLRACVAIAAFIVFLSMLSPQVLSCTVVADVRYAGPIVALWVFVAVAAIDAATKLVVKTPALRAVCALTLGGLVFATNIFNTNIGTRTSTIAAYLGELLNPPGDPFTPTAQWINQNVAPGQSIYVVPEYATYPLMFHAPKALYAWQFENHDDPQFKDFPSIHFRGGQMPDYLIGFGPFVKALQENIMKYGNGQTKYGYFARVDVFWKDMYRPELFWRTFTPINQVDLDNGAIYIFKRITQPPFK